MDSPYKRLLNNTLIFAIGNFSAKLVSFLLVRLYSQTMSAELFGIADTLYTFSELMIPLLTFGLIEGVLRFALDQNSDKAGILTSALKVTAVGVVVLAAVTPVLARVLPLYAPYVVYAVLLFAFSALRQIFAQFVRGSGGVKIFAVNGILSAVLLAVFNVLFLAVLHWGVSGYLVSAILSGALSCVHLFVSARLGRHIRLRERSGPLLRAMLLYSLPLVPNALSWWVISYSNRYILQILYSVAVSGLFAMVSKLPSIVSMLTGIFQQAWQMSSVQEYDKKERDAFYSGVFARYSALALSGGTVLIAICPILSTFLLKNEYYAGWIYAPFLIGAAVMTCFSSFFGAVYMAAKRSMNSLYTTLAGAAVSIAACLALAPGMGIQGASIATLSGAMVTAVSRMADSARYVRVTMSFWRFWASVALLIGQSVLFALWEKAALPYVCLCAAAVLLIHIGALLDMLRGLIGALTSRKRRKL